VLKRRPSAPSPTTTKNNELIVEKRFIKTEE
jgi:hypothetical protein